MEGIERLELEVLEMNNFSVSNMFNNIKINLNYKKNLIIKKKQLKECMNMYMKKQEHYSKEM